MALVVADRVKEISTTTGTGTYNLDGTSSGFRTFVDGIGDANTCLYAAFDDTDWEVGIGTVTDAAPDTLARTTILASSNAGAAVSWPAGTKTLIVTLAAGKALYRESDGSMDMKTEKILNVVDPAAAQDAATKAYVDAAGDETLIQDADADTKIQTEEAADEDKIRFDTFGIERMILDANGLQILVASPSPPQANTIVKDSIIKAWINFDGTGTITIRDSFNVASITDNGVGLTTLTWDRDFANANYVIAGSAMDNATEKRGTVTPEDAGTYLAGSVKIKMIGNSQTIFDSPYVTVIAIGDQT